MIKQYTWFLALVLATLVWPKWALSECYNPDGTQANDDVPCTSTAATFCCNKGDICMSNGLCYLQGKRGFVLSRASCTDRSWNSCGSYTYCMPYNKNSGFPIVAAQYNGSKTVHCCGTATLDNGTINCGNFKSVNIPSGTAIPGVAGLSVKSLGSSNPGNTSTPVSSYGRPSPSHETIIGVGVGVPLVVIALASIAWALWERRARFKALSTVANKPMNQHPTLGGFHQPGITRRPVELGASNISELGTGENHKPSSERQA